MFFYTFLSKLCNGCLTARGSVIIVFLLMCFCAGCGGKDIEVEIVTLVPAKISQTEGEESETDSKNFLQQEEEIIIESPLPEYQMIYPEGMTLEERFAVPQGYVRTAAEEGSLLAFLRGYALKEHGSPVLLYSGEEKWNQSVHAAVFALPIEKADLQQCADSVMRVYAEYYRSSGQYEKIAFHFTNGFLCEYTKWIEGYRVAVSGNEVHWEKSADYDDSYDTFVKYMRMVFNYAGTLSMESYESDSIALSDVEAGDVILKGGSPGHVVMVVDVCEKEEGEKAFLLAQGYMPAQEFHILLNPMHEDDPWYYTEEISFPLETAEYTFLEESMLRRLKYR